MRERERESVIDYSIMSDQRKRRGNDCVLIWKNQFSSVGCKFSVEVNTGEYTANIPPHPSSLS